MCGESTYAHDDGTAWQGPSPRVRGIRGHGELTHSAHGVHPRVCGESLVEHLEPLGREGPSPRVRGIRPPIDRDRQRPGSIPACAGNPRSTSASPTWSGVHPRVCGESTLYITHAFKRPGPSPRVRGIPLEAFASLIVAGSIPACAGNPSSGRCSSSSTRVHPRVCGESLDTACRLITQAGPSPRVRGIHQPGRC